VELVLTNQAAVDSAVCFMVAHVQCDAFCFSAMYLSSSRLAKKATDVGEIYFAHHTKQ
jgi:hypothetical protein